MLKYKHLFYLLILYLFFQFTILSVWDSPLITQLDELIIGLLLGSMFLLQDQGSFTPRRTYMDIILILISVFFFISFIFNDVPFLNAVLSFKSYFLFYSLFYFFVYANFDLNPHNRIIKFILYIYLFEFVVQVMQVLWGLHIGFLDADSSPGTHPVLGYSFFFPVFYITYLYIFEKNSRYLPYLVILILSMLITYSDFCTIMIIAMFVLFNMNKIIFNKKNISKFTVIAVFFASIMFFLNTFVVDPQRGTENNKSGTFYLFDPFFYLTFFEEQEMDAGFGSGRLLWYPVTYERVQKYAVSPFIGMGPGMYASYTAENLMTKPHKSIYNIFGQIEMGFDTAVDSQLIPIWGELGYLGVALFILFFIISSRHFYKIYKRSSLPQVKALAITASAGSLFLLFGMYVNHLLEFPLIMFLYILFCGLAEHEYRKERLALFTPSYSKEY